MALTKVSLDGRLQVNALARLLAAIALDVSGPGLAHGATVRTLRDGTALFVDVLKRPGCEGEAHVSNWPSAATRQVPFPPPCGFVIGFSGPETLYPKTSRVVFGVWRLEGPRGNNESRLAPKLACKRLTRMLAVADAVATHAGVAGKLLAVN